MGKRILLFIVAVSMLSVWGYSQVPTLKPTRVNTPPVLDGVLSDAEWKNAVSVQLNKHMDGTPAPHKTTVYLTCDDDNLYIAYRCFESDIKNIYAKATCDDDLIFLDDVAEIMIASAESASEGNYVHIGINANNYVYASDLKYPDRNPVIKSAVGKFADQWTIEMAIKLDSIVDPNENAAFWRINLMRERQGTPPEYTSWIPTKGPFHNPQVFGRLTGLDRNGKFIGLRSVLSPLKVKGDKTAVYSLATATSPLDLPVHVIPLPKSITMTGTDFVITPETRILIPNKPSHGEEIAAQGINEELIEYFGFSALPIVKVDDVLKVDLKNTIVLGEAKKTLTMKALGDNYKVKMPGAEGYILRSFPDTIVVAGSDERGTFYGSQSLKQLIRGTAKKLVIKGANIDDEPTFKVRSVHIILDNNSPKIHRRQFRDLIARYKYNQVVVELENGLQFKSHPEINKPFAANQEEVRELVKYGKSLFLDMVPMVQSLGHGEWMFSNTTWQKTRTWMNEDFCEETASHYAYCPLNKKSYDFIFALFDEAIDVFDHPQYLHIGHDEVEMRGHFPSHEECKAIGAGGLYFMDTIKLYNYLKSKGIKTMMWGDVLATKNYVKYLNGIPKDLVIVDWRYSPNFEYPSVTTYKEYNLPIIGGTWDIPTNISRFAEYGHQNKILGMMQTTWPGYNNNDVLVEKYPSQIAAYIIAGDYFWNPVDRDINNLGYEPFTILYRQWYQMAADKPLRKGFSVNLSSVANITLSDDSAKRGFLQVKPGYDLSLLTAPGKTQLLDGVTYKFTTMNGTPVGVLLQGSGISNSFPTQVKNIAINRKASSLNFLHTCLYSTPTGSTVGRYTIKYTDGTNIVIPIVYGVNLSAWQDGGQYSSGNFVWSGNTRTGQPVYLQAPMRFHKTELLNLIKKGNGSPVYLKKYNWSNPHPEKTIQSIDMEQTGNPVSLLLMAITGAE